MTDRELLLDAAKAAGMVGWRYAGPSGLHKMIDPYQPETTGSIGPAWNPLIDDGDALRLAVSLDLSVFPNDMPSAVSKYALVESHCGNFRGVVSWVEESKSAAVRRAIVNAAAEIGKEMP